MKNEYKYIINIQSFFNNINKKDYCSIRDHCYPLSALQKGIFINRSALKLVEFNYLLNFLNDKTEYFSFCDICGGPGGFVEYIMNLCLKYNIKYNGYGISLKNENNWRFEEEKSNSFRIIYGEDNTGDITIQLNRINFINEVLKINKDGVNLVTCDGALNNNYNCDIKLLNLIISELIIGIKVINNDGIIILKSFGLKSPSIISLIYIIIPYFKYWSVYKPLTSRPGSSECYILFKYLINNNINPLISKLNEISSDLMNIKDNKLCSLINIEIIKEDKKFLDEIIRINDEYKIYINRLIKLQYNTYKIMEKEYYKRTELPILRKDEINRIYKLWKLDE